MRFKEGSKHAFDTEEVRTGMHKLSQEDRILSQAERGKLSPTEAVNMTQGMSAVSAGSLARRLAERAKKASE